MPVQVMPLVDLIRPKQQLLVHQVQIASKIVGLLWELGGEKVRQEDHFCFAARVHLLAQHVAHVISHV